MMNHMKQRSVNRIETSHASKLFGKRIVMNMYVKQGVSYER